MMTDENFFTIDEILETIENADDYEATCFDDLFNSLFNEGYYIIGTYKAAEALKSYKYNEAIDYCDPTLDGIFGAMELVKTYEEDNFGEVVTKFDDPEQLANMVEYIRAEAVYAQVLENAELDLDDDATPKNVKKLIESAKKMKKEHKKTPSKNEGVRL